MSAAAIPGLSVRLRNIAEMVTPGSRLADVGTDHAWLPVWLCKQGRINAAVAMDLREGPLAAARVHIREAGLEKKIAVRLSDGLRELKTGEADCIVIAGMGGELIRRILADDADRLHTYSELILGPQSEPEKLKDRKEGTAPARAEELKKEEQLLAAALKRYEM